MKKILLLLVIASYCLSCSNDDDGNIPDIITYSFVEDAMIITNEVQGFSLASQGEGNNLVFEYRMEEGDDPDIADDEYVETILFEIPLDATSFQYTDEEILDTKMYFSQFCYCDPIGSIQISKGVLKGEKQNDNSWSIELDVTFAYGNQEKSRKIEAGFELVDKPL